MASRDQMRAADADRERVAAQLREALEQGRLGLHEFDERLGQAYAAHTFAELDRAVADLPPPAAEEQSAMAPSVPSAKPSTTHPPSRHDPVRRFPAWLRWLWGAWALAVTTNLVIWFLVVVSVPGFVYFWPMWVAGPWGAVNIGLMFLFPPRPVPSGD